jgi:hypothetical protein
VSKEELGTRALPFVVAPLSAYARSFEKNAHHGPWRIYICVACMYGVYDTYEYIYICVIGTTSTLPTSTAS